MLRSVDDDTWVSALANPDNVLIFPWSGYDVVSDQWAYHDRVLADHLMYLITDGEMVGEVDGSPIHLSAGNLLWMQPEIRHTFALHPEGVRPTLYFVRFRLRVDDVDLGLRGRSHRWWEDGWELRSLIEELIDEISTRLPHRASRLRALLLSVCSAALRQDERDTEPSAGTLTRTQRDLLEGHVRADPAHRSTPAELAILMGLSPDYFTRLFRRTFGVPPRVWLVQERLDRAARALVESTRSVSSIARSLGYDDATAFSHQFKHHTGISPRDYRRRG